MFPAKFLESWTAIGPFSSQTEPRLILLGTRYWAQDCSDSESVLLGRLPIEVL
jgi:hypothetical protein